MNVCTVQISPVAAFRHSVSPVADIWTYELPRLCPTLVAGTDHHTHTEYNPLTPENIYKVYLIKNRTNCADCHVQDKTGHIYLPATYFRVPFIPLSLCFTIPVPPKPP